jgi:hypothetical protein
VPLAAAEIATISRVNGISSSLACLDFESRVKNAGDFFAEVEGLVLPQRALIPRVPRLPQG